MQAEVLLPLKDVNICHLHIVGITSKNWVGMALKKPNKYVATPPESSTIMQQQPPDNLLSSQICAVEYPQENTDSCFSSGFASAVYAYATEIGDENLKGMSSLIRDMMDQSLGNGCEPRTLLNRVVWSLLRKYQMTKKYCYSKIHNFRKNCPTTFPVVAILEKEDTRKNHAVGVMGNHIFDARFDKALILCEESYSFCADYEFAKISTAYQLRRIKTKTRKKKKEPSRKAAG